MRFYTQQHKHYCGIDLHARIRYVCILDGSGTVLLSRNIDCSAESFLFAVKAYRDDLVVAVECMFTWYWPADLCARQNIAFVLGHALYMRAIHGGKAKNDRIDAHKIAGLLQLGHWALAITYFYLHDINAFLTEADVAIRLNPNNATVISQLGLYILFVGEWDRGVKLIDKAVQLNPYHPAWYHWGYHNYYYHKCDYEKALNAAQQIGLPNVFWTPLCLAEDYGQLGRLAEARAAAAQIAALYPGFNLRTARSEMEKFNFTQEHIQHRLDGLRKAGVVE